MKKTIKLLIGLFLIVEGTSKLSAQSFYNTSTIQSIQVYMSQPNWDQLMDNAIATTGDYIMADSVLINGVAFDSVGVKYKGNSSYNANHVKNPWHIELDTYINQDYQGYKDIKLANVAKDPSFIRDVLGFQIVRQYMDAPLSNFANLYVNGNLIGLYTNTEAISKVFLEDRFGHKTNTFFSCSPPAGASPTSGSYPNLVYLGPDSVNYYEEYEIKSSSGWQELIDLCDTLSNNVTAIESVLDIDRAIWMLAMDNAIVNLDSYIGAFSQNYYLYKDNYGRMLPVMWDLNESFGTFSNTGTTTLNNITAKRQMSHLLHSTDASWPLVSKVFSVPTYKRMYLAHLKTIMEENFTNDGPYYVMAQSINDIIDAAVNADPNKFYSYAQFNSNLTTDITGGGGPGGGTTPGITSLMNGRYTYLMAQSDFTAIQPTIQDIVVSDMPTIGSAVNITAVVGNADAVYLRHRHLVMAPFDRVQMFDDGNHNDGLANDQVYGASFTLSSTFTEYYIYAENATIGKFSPARAEHEFYTIVAVGGIAPGNVVINEFMASNTSSMADQDGEFDDWIEVYNNGTTSIDLSGYRLTNDLTNLTAFTFPAGSTLAPDSYLVVWADKDLLQSGMHANFKIAATGSTLYFTNANLSVIDSIAFSTQLTDQTLGRYPNGTGNFQTLVPTFAANNNSTVSVADDVLKVENEWNVYPNPTEGQFTIDLTQVQLGAQPLNIYNHCGQLIFSDLIKDKGTYSTEGWTNGLYLIQVGNQTRRLIIQK
jgi:hypothetical protein